MHLLALISKKHHTDPAQHEHGPVGKTTEKNHYLKAQILTQENVKEYRRKDESQKYKK